MDFAEGVGGEGNERHSICIFNTSPVHAIFKNILFLISERVEKTTTIEKKTMDIEERGVKLRLTVVDTPGAITTCL